MNYDSFCMAATLEELQADYIGAFVDQVYQPDPVVVVLAFTGRGPRRYWLLSSDARWPRSHATTQRRPNPDTPPNFCMLLRKHIGGAHLAEAKQVRFDRILRLTFRRGDETRVLVHEVMGRHSNLILLDESDAILGAVKVVPPSQTRVRPVLPGSAYTTVPDQRPDPRGLSLEELGRTLSDVETPEGITRALSGWGPFAAREAFALVTDGDLAPAVHGMMERVRRRDYAPVVLEAADGRPKGVWAFPSVQEGWRENTPATTVSAACDRFYGYLEQNGAEEALRKSVLGVLNRSLKTARIQLSEAEAFLNGLDQAELFRVKGELLASQGGRIERGERSVEVANWYDADQRPLRIELDPEKDARENAERYFHRYRRANAGAEAALERIPELTEQIAALEALSAEGAGAAEERLRELIPEARRAAPRLVGSPGAARAKVADGEKPVASEFPPGVRVKRVPVGTWDVYYGENATSNDYLTTRWAKSGDLWLHARAVTGCHVVVRGVNTLDRLPPEVLREAARLAASHSEAKHSSVVPVDYTFKRHVRKPRGSGPGRVTYTGERTIHVDPAVGSQGAERESAKAREKGPAVE